MPVKTLDEYLKQTTPITTKQQATKPKYRIAGFYKETQFRETPIGRIPKEWQVLRLRELFTYIKGKKPKNLIKEEKEGYLPYLTTDYLRTGVPSNYAKHEKDTTIVDDNDILLLWDGSNAGEFFLGKKGILASTMVKLVPKINEISTLFYFYYLKLVENRLKSLTKGTGIPHVEKSVFENLQLIKPPLEEQWGIAEVLSSVDRAIEATERLIGRLERLKRALMQELLTRGIGHREYKQTPIGKIPKEWKIVKIENIAKVVKTGPFGSQLRKSELTRKGIKVYTQENVLKRDFSIGNLYISEKKFNQLKNFEVKPNDVLLTIRGTVGKAAVVPYHVERGIIHTNLAIIRVDDTKILPRYLELVINEADIVARQVKASHSSTTLPALYAGTIKRLKIPLPSLEEQKKIVDIISSVNKWIELERKRKEKLERLKRGLMELLLTGRVRVRVERLDDEGNLPGSGGGVGS